MARVKVIYWSQGGNTKRMAEAVVQGIEESGNEAEPAFVTMEQAAKIRAAKAFALGCPAMGNEVLEEREMEPFIQLIEKELHGKTVLLFGSYGWGDGQWMRDWEKRMRAAGAVILGGEGIICRNAPDEETTMRLFQAGKTLAALA